MIDLKSSFLSTIQSILLQTQQENLAKLKKKDQELEKAKKRRIGQEEVILNLKSSHQKTLDDMQRKEQELGRASLAAKELQKDYYVLLKVLQENLAKLEEAKKLGTERGLTIQNLESSLKKTSDKFQKKAKELEIANQASKELQKCNSDLEKAHQESLAKLEGKDIELEKQRGVQKQVIKILESSRQKAEDDLMGKMDELKSANQAAAKELQQCYSDLKKAHQEIFAKQKEKDIELEKQRGDQEQAIENLKQCLQKVSNELLHKTQELEMANQTAQELLKCTADFEKAHQENLAKLKEKYLEAETLLTEELGAKLAKIEDELKTTVQQLIAAVQSLELLQHRIQQVNPCCCGTIDLLNVVVCSRAE